MKFSLAYFTLFAILGAFDSATLYLAGQDSKQWSLYVTTPAAAIGSCQASHPVAQDNTYTFHTDGSFEFDHGTVTEDPGCQEEDCCSDLVNITGTWKFLNNDKRLRITAVQEKDNAENKLDIILFDATIDQLDENVLKISQTDKTTNTLYTFEFRKR